MRPPRLSAKALSDHLFAESPAVRRRVRALRKTVFKCVPDAAEGIKFHALSYYHAQAWFKSIGGNICMIEIRDGGVTLSFIHGAHLPDPHHLLRGKGKSKRFLDIPDMEAASSPRLVALLSASQELRLWK